MKNPLPIQSITPRRKAVYYSGLGFMLLGAILFLSTFISFAMHFGDFNDFETRTRSDALRALAGIVCLIVGGVVAGVGARGPAGSGLLLDPERAARDLQPFARMSGKLTDTAFSEMETVRQTLADISGGGVREVVRIRCRACQALNDESDRYCGQCGAAMK
jgi:hypothetical protein